MTSQAAAQEGRRLRSEARAAGVLSWARLARCTVRSRHQWLQEERRRLRDSGLRPPGGGGWEVNAAHCRWVTAAPFSSGRSSTPPPSWSAAATAAGTQQQHSQQHATAKGSQHGAACALLGKLGQQVGQLQGAGAAAGHLGRGAGAKGACGGWEGVGGGVGVAASGCWLLLVSVVGTSVVVVTPVLVIMCTSGSQGKSTEGGGQPTDEARGRDAEITHSADTALPSSTIHPWTRPAAPSTLGPAQPTWQQAWGAGAGPAGPHEQQGG